MSINVNDKNIGHATAYAYYKAGGGTMTEAEFTEFMADFGTASQTAVEAAQAALASKNAAQTAATTATNKASEASQSASAAHTDAETASQSASQASTSAQTATTKASEASASASTATAKATEATTAATSANTAKTDAVAAKTAAETAQGKAETAQGAAETAAQSVSASAAQIATNTADIADIKENLTDMQSDGVAPSAEQLLSKNMTADAVPYHFRQTGGNGADREYVDAIVGGTVNWNQLVYTSQVDASKTQNGVTITDNRDGTYTVSTDANGATADTYSVLSNANVTLKVGHKYLFCGTPSTGSANTYYSYMAGVVTLYDYGKGLVFVVPTDGSVTIVVAYIKQGTVITTPVTFKQQIFDLTAMFGSTIADHIYSLEQATAGAGVAFFKKLFPNDYYEYNAGELKSVEGVSAHKTVGFNQWDEEWENGRININTGAKITGKGVLSKNMIPVIPSTVYHGHSGSYVGASGIVVCYYDANGSYLLYENKVGSDVDFTTPANCHFIKFNIQTSAEVTTYNHDICINLSDPAKDGTYEPYKAHSYPLDSTLTFRGTPKLSDGKLYYDGDTYEADGTVTRKYGIVDLGTLTWSKSGTRMLSSNGLSNVPAVTITTSTVPNARCDKYMPDKWSSTSSGAADKIFCVIGTQVIVMDSAYTDASTFKTAMNGVMLVYELATPTTEEAEPYQHLQQCDPNGTEEFVSTGIVPVGHETRYPENLRAKIEGLPWNFASLIAPTEKTTTASRNYTTGSLLIMGNVLYKVTANIANGGTITPNTNVTATTLSEILSALAQ